MTYRGSKCSLGSRLAHYDQTTKILFYIPQICLFEPPELCKFGPTWRGVAKRVRNLNECVKIFIVIFSCKNGAPYSTAMMELNADTIAAAVGGVLAYRFRYQDHTANLMPFSCDKTCLVLGDKCCLLENYNYTQKSVLLEICGEMSTTVLNFGER